MMMRFSERSGGVLAAAYQLAKGYSLNYIGTEHLLAGILAEGQGAACELLSSADVTIEKVQDALNQMSQQPPQEIEPEDGLDAEKVMAMFTPRTKRVVELAAYEARMRQLDVIEPEHLLMGIVREGESVAMRILKANGLEPRSLYNSLSQRIQGLTSSGSPSAQAGSGADDSGEFADINRKLEQRSGGGAGSKSKTPTLEKFGRDLTQYASQGRFDPIIGRAEEISRVMQILSRRTKNNPCLIGEPGVGKTAIAEGLAQKIASGDVPGTLKGQANHLS